jgi:hypothetical protein
METINLDFIEILSIAHNIDYSEAIKLNNDITHYIISTIENNK